LLHDILQLAGQLAWPLVALYFMIKFGPAITALLNELPLLVRRMRSAHGLGVEIELDRLDVELPVAEQQAHSLTLKKTPGQTMTGPEPKKIGADDNG
jgi:hypothetical protein